MRNRYPHANTLFFIVLCAILIVGTGPAKSFAEPATPQTSQEPSPVVMIALPWDDPSIRIPAPQQIRAESAPTATFSINYLPAGTSDGQGATCLAWSASAQAAFSYAVSVWATMINSTVPIRINACWANLGSSSILGYSWSNSIRNFTGAPQSNTWYSYSLADALAGSDLDPAKPDTYITYNNGFAWYFGTDGSTPSGQHDFVSVVMHEMGHGLNFSGQMSYGSSRCGGASYGCWGGGTGSPGIYDRFTENGAGEALLNTSLFPNPSAALGSQLTSNNLYFDGPNANAANGGSRVKIYAPSTWAPGSSYSHLDYSTFRSTVHRMMVYALPSASSIHDPGSVTMGLLKDLGWNTTTNNPVPAISGLSPSLATPGGPAFTLTVNGTGFVSTSKVRWNGADRTTTYVSGTQLTAAITAADIAAATTASVTVFNPAPGGGTSNAVSFVVGNPVPTISSLSPSSATPGGPAFTLTVNGTGFVSTSKVRWNGADRTTTYVSGTQLTAAITAADIAAATTASVTVFNPAPGGGTSNAVSFVVGNPVPTISSLSPSSATPGGPAFTLTVNGAGFVSTSKVRWNGADRTTTYVSGTQLTVAITAADIAAATTASVTVFNPAPGGGTSNAVSFVVGTLKKVYLPLVLKNFPPVTNDGINGRITYNGANAAGIGVTLRFWNGSAWSSAATTTTDAAGRYRFLGAASLGSGQKYYVRFGPNSSNSAYLYAWWGPDITSYTSGSTVPGGDFDIANVVLTSPANNSTVHLPTTLSWQQRGISTDTYRVTLFDTSTGDDWITNDLGNVGSFNMTGMPPGAVYGKAYGWDVRVFNGANSFGESYYYRVDHFRFRPQPGAGNGVGMGRTR